MSWKKSLLYILFPYVVATLVISSYYVSPEFNDLMVNPRAGFLEVVTGSLLMCVFLYAVYLLSRGHVWKNIALRCWLLAYALGVFYFMGEDQNWGQFYFNLEPPEYFLENNKEQEINLHNMSSWFNQKPRLVVEIWLIIVGILVPLGWRWPVKKTVSFVPQIFWIFNKRVVPVALAAEILRIPHKLLDFGIIQESALTIVRYSEVQEWFIAYFMLLFLVELHSKLSAEKK